MPKLIHDATMEDIIAGVQYLLEKARQSQDVTALAYKIASAGDDAIASIYDWAKQHVQYRLDPEGVERFNSPVWMVQQYYRGEQLYGDCDDYAIFITALYRAIGLVANVEILDTKGNDWDHAVSRVFAPQLGVPIMVDPSTATYPLGWEENAVRRLQIA